jgi:hypothetical protein
MGRGGRHAAIVNLEAAGGQTFAAKMAVFLDTGRGAANRQRLEIYFHFRRRRFASMTPTG